MRRALAAAALAAAIAAAGSASAQEGDARPAGQGNDPAAPGAPDGDGEHFPGDGHDHDHGGESRFVLSDLTPAQRKLALDAFAHVYCRCPEENWSRTLANCPDGCADPQKQEIMGQVQEGWSLAAIVEEQVNRYGDRANADPGTAVNGTLLVVAGLLGGAAAAGLVLAAWRRAAAERLATTRAAREENPASDAEIAAVERELAEID